MRLPILTAAAAVLLLGASSAARADIAVLRSGATLKVTAHRVEAGTVVMSLAGGGEVGVVETELRGIVPDEVLEELAAAPVASGPTDLAALVTAAARRHSIDPELVRAVIAVESAFRPDAVSPKGAQGLMQLMPATARSLGVTDAFDPADNVEGGTRHLRALIDRYQGDVKRALAAYNAGEGAVARHGGVPPYPETRAYVEKVLQRAQAYAPASR
jgi:soluble lytic murein transglycosylase-like protein